MYEEPKARGSPPSSGIGASGLLDMILILNCIQEIRLKNIYTGLVTVLWLL